MASSLEELLEEEGFRGSRSMMRPRSSLRLESLSMPLYPLRDQRKSSTSGVRIKTERTRSDVSRYNLTGELPTSDRVRCRRPRDNLVRREKLDERPKIENREIFEGRGSNNMMEGKRVNVDSMDGLPRNEIVEVGEEENQRFKDIYSNEVYSPGRGEDTFSSGTREKERYKDRSGKDIKVDKRYSHSSNKHLLGRTSFSDNNRKSMKQTGTSYDRSNRSSWNVKSFEESRSQRRDNNLQVVPEPALDEVAVQAMVSIISGYIKRFLRDEDFRTSLRDNCFSSLAFIQLEEGYNADRKVMSNLEQAIETVERAAEESASTKDLKKASLTLSVIAGLNSNDLKDGFTSGVPNSKLSACAHVYLSVIYKLQKKDRVSATHLLQVFRDSPFQARTTLLPELWDHLFLPHLSHLKAWYNQESESLTDTPSRPRKLKLLEKVYNEILDSGTYQFAVYYKDWLTEGVEAPSIPSIRIPSVSVQKFEQGGLHSHSSEVASPVGPFLTSADDQ
ncbi:hypothetical protein L1049_018353 [Liquidambar formosana]|uniref:Putative E3 ubiquitin-protein ligase LIN N-terminal domain-containing protein n=1 Tax=Liquidambar formosana TaxID=63359 RepID=A0AAP0R9Z3_LIQFO